MKQKQQKITITLEKECAVYCEFCGKQNIFFISDEELEKNLKYKCLYCKNEDTIKGEEESNEYIPQQKP